MSTLMELFGGVKQTQDSQAGRLRNNHAGTETPMACTPEQEAPLKNAQKTVQQVRSKRPKGEVFSYTFL